VTQVTDDAAMIPKVARIEGGADNPLAEFVETTLV
jgi:hypothetical protein